MKLFERIDMLDKYLTTFAIQKAKAKFDHLLGDVDGEISIIQAAKDGDKTASNFLFDFYKRWLGKAFFSYYVGENRKRLSGIIANGEHDDFAAECYQMFLPNTDNSGPLARWDYSKQDESGKPLKSFGFYVLRYAQSIAKRLKRANSKEGMTDTGKILPSSISLNDEPLGSDGASFGDTIEDTRYQPKEDAQFDSQITSTLKKLTKKFDKDVLKTIASNPDADTPQKIADILGSAYRNVTNALQRIKIAASS